ncbi:CLUMA_CG001536, isoform A [Clunio marinus]|uniref:Glucosidase II subunit alpha n=1 Tax=Clunio marinus TaxID=568069 RepID=A0A1J1HNH3_9DIPT|nr:CLUMA_CG001536, isoform A [Clunio marinus]
MRSISIVLLMLIVSTFAVDKNNFKTCEQSSFCRRCRKVQPGSSPYEIIPNTLNTYANHITADIRNNENQHVFVLKLEALKGNMFHFEIDEKSPLKPRYRVTDALQKEPTYESIKVSSTSSEITIISGRNKAVVFLSPFKIEFFQDETLVTSVNSRGLMNFEHLRKKPEPPAGEQEGAEGDESKIDPPEDDPGAWEENFKGHHDSKPNGPSAVALDFTFHQANILFGIPEHADSFALKSTNGGDPYRLYNLDVFEYELQSTMALYGSVPIIYGHGAGATTGIFWQNAAETWVDIAGISAEQNVMSSIVNFVAGSRQSDPPSAHFMSESGIIDTFVLLGSNPNEAFHQYTDLTGNGKLPQMFAIAYHQCRWNYNDEQDVAQVVAKFDEHDIPMDTMWLDIEYTEGKKYFTWDHTKFPHPVEMMKNLSDVGRHLTIIIDPHIKRDSSYFFHNDCTDKGYYIKNKDGKDYEGWCWPGAASYPDFFNPEIRKYYADQYLLDNFKESTIETGIWNDMNEPSVFNGPEITMLKDNLHYGGWEHRDVHNLYGQMQLVGTYDGLVRRSGGSLRPFILTRAHFAGTQRYAGVWTGDNAAEWSHLEMSIPMCLSLSVSGISFCGADVGGFFGNPDGELFYRWNQAGAFQPFFRGHAHIDTKRREPWLFPEDVKLVVRDAIRKRYSYLAFWYTMFYEHERSGLPIMRPMLSQYPLDKNAYALDDQYMLSDKLLVRPVMQKGASKVDVYFPSKNGEKQGDIWYDIDDYRKIERVGVESVSVNSYKIPVYQRGGTIIPKKERIRRSAVLMQDDPFTLIVAVDENNTAKGTLYIDDEKTFEYRQGKYLYLDFEFKDGVLSSRYIDETAKFSTKTWLERVVIVGLNKTPTSATLRTSDNKSTQLEIIDVKKTSFVIRKPGVSMMDNTWSITLNY